MKFHSEGDASIISLPGRGKGMTLDAATMGTKGVQQCIGWLNRRAVVGVRKYGND